MSNIRDKKYKSLKATFSSDIFKSICFWRWRSDSLWSSWCCFFSNKIAVFEKPDEPNRHQTRFQTLEDFSVFRFQQKFCDQNISQNKLVDAIISDCNLQITARCEYDQFKPFDFFSFIHSEWKLHDGNQAIERLKLWNYMLRSAETKKWTDTETNKTIICSQTLKKLKTDKPKL